MRRSTHGARPEAVVRDLKGTIKGAGDVDADTKAIMKFRSSKTAS